MSSVARLPLYLILLVSSAWVGIWTLFLFNPFVQAVRSALAEHPGIGAVSFSLSSVLWRVGLVVIPPATLLVTWLASRRAV
jgi:hypothetical protein